MIETKYPSLVVGEKYNSKEAAYDLAYWLYKGGASVNRLKARKYAHQQIRAGRARSRPIDCGTTREGAWRAAGVSVRGQRPASTHDQGIQCFERDRTRSPNQGCRVT